MKANMLKLALYQIRRPGFSGNCATMFSIAAVVGWSNAQAKVVRMLIRLMVAIFQLEGRQGR